VTVRAIAGLLVLNVFVLAVGAGVLWGIRGWRWWTDFLRLAGGAYFLGLAALLIVTMVELVAGIPVEPATVLLSGAGIVAAGILVGRRRGLAAPALRPPDRHFPRISVFAAVFLAGIVVYFEAFLRAGRLAGVAREWDSWANWLPKSRSLYLTGGLDLEFLALVPQLTSYPPGHTTLQALAFHAMGSADTVTLHLQYWFMGVFFALAVIGLLTGRVHHAILFPVLLALLVAPYLLDWLTTVYADLPLGYFVALAALLLVLWIEERKPWQLAAATLLLSGGMLTKREGMLFAACVVLAGLVASFRERRQLWRSLFAAGLIAFALVLPWRVWFTFHDLPAVGPDTGYVGALAPLDRLWPSLETTVETLFHPDLWLATPLLAVSASALSLLAGSWRVPLFAGAFLVSAVAVVTGVLWYNLAVNLTFEDWPTRRLVGTPVLALAVLTPLLLQKAWSSNPVRGAPVVHLLSGVFFRPTSAAWAIVLVGLLVFPVSALVATSRSGLPGGWPSFPGTTGCDAAPVDGAKVRLVVGYADSYPEAEAMRARARVAGLEDVEASQDGCGRLRVYVDDLPTSDAAQALVAEAQAAGLASSVEFDPDD
jgi:hypothetical protein